MHRERGQRRYAGSTSWYCCSSAWPTWMWLYWLFVVEFALLPAAYTHIDTGLWSASYASRKPGITACICCRPPCCGCCRPEMELGHILWRSDPATRRPSWPGEWPCSIMNSKCRLMYAALSGFFCSELCSANVQRCVEQTSLSEQCTHQQKNF